MERIGKNTKVFLAPSSHTLCPRIGDQNDNVLFRKLSKKTTEPKSTYLSLIWYQLVFYFNCRSRLNAKQHQPKTCVIFSVESGDAEFCLSPRF